MKRCLQAIRIGVGAKGKMGHVGWPETREELEAESRKWSMGQSPSDTRYAFLEGCLCSGDGSLIPIAVGGLEPGRWRCRKGFLATNVLGFVSYDKCFFDLSIGAEGSAHDSTVLKWANMERRMPAGYFCLFDAGVSLTFRRWLTPFRGVRYHLKEYGFGTKAPQTAQELFNLRHSVRRSQTVECAWGLLKGRWRILRKGIEVDTMDTVRDVIAACATLHNYMQVRVCVYISALIERRAYCFSDSMAKRTPSLMSPST